MRYIRPISIAVLFSISVRAYAQYDDDGSRECGQIDSLLKTLYAGNQPGISIAILNNDKPFFKASYGVANVESKIKLDSETNFNIGSLTKQFTAMSVLQLASKKKLSLSDPISKFFPGFNKKEANLVTVRELLTHSSGIRDHYGLTDTNNLKHAHILDVLAAIRNTDTGYFTPGSQFRYSNTGYCLLALIVEKLSGMSYSDYLMKNIFVPLRMTQTKVWSETAKIDREATGYNFDKAALSFYESGPNENIFFSTEGDGGIYTSVDDYIKWFHALQTGKIVSRKIIREARSSQFPIDKEKHLSYGYGWFVDDGDPASMKVYHSGSNGGFRAYSFSIPASGFLIVIFSNRDGIDLEQVVHEIYGIIFH